MPIFAVRCVGKKEKQLIEAIEINAKSHQLPIKAALYVPEIKGYVFVEADSEETIKKAIAGMPFVKGIISKPVDPKELEKFFEERSEIAKFKEGDIVEIIGGPFKKEKAKIITLDSNKNEAKVELIDSSIPIPITIKLELLRKAK